MRFWDTSALAPLVVREATTDQMRAIRDEDLELYAWWGTRVECVSAIARLVREGRLRPTEEREVREALDHLFEEIAEVAATNDVRARAERCLGVHPLRAADAFQLGAALTWARERPKDLGFVSLDARLREAARREGFTLVPA